MIKDLLLLNPKLSVVALSFLITLVMTLITKKFTNQSRMKELKDIQKSCQIKIRSGNLTPEEMSKVNKQMMECSMELMKHSFKPLLITLIPLIILFWWIRGIYSPVLSSWIWWYIISGIISSIILRKALKVA